jgi:hypothetical protein
MPTVFKKLEDEPIVIVTLPIDYNLAAELPKLMPQYINLLNAATEPVYWVVDARNSSLTVEEIILGASLLARGEHPLYHHPNVREVIYVTSSQIMKLAADGMKGDSFGNVNIKMFDDLDQAMDYIHKNK